MGTEIRDGFSLCRRCFDVVCFTESLLISSRTPLGYAGSVLHSQCSYCEACSLVDVDALRMRTSYTITNWNPGEKVVTFNVIQIICPKPRINCIFFSKLRKLVIFAQTYNSLKEIVLNVKHQIRF